MPKFTGQRTEGSSCITEIELILPEAQPGMSQLGGRCKLQHVRQRLAYQQERNKGLLQIALERFSQITRKLFNFFGNFLQSNDTQIVTIKRHIINSIRVYKLPEFSQRAGKLYACVAGERFERDRR